jgi:hypothetical protein
MSERTPVLNHWLEEYEGRDVMVQFKGVHYSVQHHAVPIPLNEQGRPIDMENKPEPIVDFLKMPFLSGRARIKSDKQGNYRIVVRTPDPTGTGDFVHVDLDPEFLEAVSVIEESSLIERAPR